MNQALVDKVVQAVLYEGYILYPYRPSVKNQQRWTFGGIYPQSYSVAQGGSDAWTMQTQCLVLAHGRPMLTVTVRFLHLVQRTVGELAAPLTEPPESGEPPFRPVESLQIGDKRYDTWQEAVERDIALGELDLEQLTTRAHGLKFALPGSRMLEYLTDATGKGVGLLVREQQAIEGIVEVSAERKTGNAFKVTVNILNLTPLDDAEHRTRDEALMRSLVSTHTILSLREGEFVSLMDPPEPWRSTVAECRNAGTWPVLVGQTGEKDTMLSSPIILYDYPQIAPESPGNLFDGTEIDEILTLRIMTLTDQEKQAAAAVDEQARALLQRTESLAREQMAGLHGALRRQQSSQAARERSGP